MKIIDLSIKRPVSVLVGVILIMIFGVLALRSLPMQLKPTIDNPIITVTTDYPGAGPQEVEDQITNPIEEKLNSVENVKKIISTSSEGRSAIRLEFDWGVDKDIASIDILKKLNLVGSLPDEAEAPIIAAITSDEERPILWMRVKGKIDVNQMRKIADDIVEPRINRVEGVGTVRIYGGQEREIQLIVDHRALSARGITLAHLKRVLDQENKNVRGGHLDEGKRRFTVRTIGQFKSTRDIENVIIAKNSGGPVYVRDVGKVVDTFKDRVSFSKEHGEPTIGFGVIRKTGANTIKVIEGVKGAIGELNEELAHIGVRLIPIYDESDYIYSAIDLVTNNLKYGAFLAAIVLIFFIRSLRSTFIIAFAIPVSLVGTFILLVAFGRSLNIISLAGLAFAVGMLVDNSIVVLENIYRHLQMGKSRTKAALDATSEVWGAILASTLTTIAVFFPIIIVKEEAGQLFKDIAIAIACSVGLSLIVSITVIPMLCAKYLKSRNTEGAVSAKAKSANLVLDVLLLRWLGRFYMAIIMKLVSHVVCGRKFSTGHGLAWLVAAAASVAMGTALLSSRGDYPLRAFIFVGVLSFLILDGLMPFMGCIISGKRSGQSLRGAARRSARQEAGGLLIALFTGLSPALTLFFYNGPEGYKFFWEGAAQAHTTGLWGAFFSSANPSAAARWGLYGDLMFSLTPAVAIPIIYAAILLFPRGAIGAKLRPAADFSANAWFSSFSHIALTFAVIAFLAIGFSFSLNLLPKAEYLPVGNRNFVFVMLKPHIGTNLDKLEELTMSLHDKLVNLPEVKYIFAIGSPRFKGIGIIAKKEYEPRLKALVKKVQGMVAGATGFEYALALQLNIFERSFGKGFDVVVKGKDLEKIQQYSSAIMRQIAPAPFGRGELKGATFVRTSYEEGNPELTVVVDRQRAADIGLSVSEVADVVETLIAGKKASLFRDGGEEVDITVKGPYTTMADVGSLGDLVVQTSSGKMIELGGIARILRDTGPTKIDHTELDRSITLTVNLDDETTLEEALNYLKSSVVGPMRKELPPGYSIRFEGSADKLELTKNALYWSTILAVVIIYLLMSALFESFLYPLIIMMTVPLAASGAMLAVKITRAEFNVITMMGFIILSGIVVNNALLIVHQALNFIRGQSYPYYESIVESTRTRIRPIYMSVATSVLGMLPLAAGNNFDRMVGGMANSLGLAGAARTVGLISESASSAGSELYSGLGAAVVGGLMISTIFTIIMVPAAMAAVGEIKTLLSKATVFLPNRIEAPLPSGGFDDLRTPRP